VQPTSRRRRHSSSRERARLRQQDPHRESSPRLWFVVADLEPVRLVSGGCHRCCAPAVRLRGENAQVFATLSVVEQLPEGSLRLPDADGDPSLDVPEGGVECGTHLGEAVLEIGEDITGG